MTSKNRAVTHSGSKADRIIDMMRDGIADGGTAAELAALLGDTNSKMISAILRYALRRGVVEVVFDDGRCTYHLVREVDDDDYLPVRRINSSAAKVRLEFRPAAPVSVFSIAQQERA